MSFPGNINLNNLASLMASAGGAGAFPGFNAAAMAAAAACQPPADQAGGAVAANPDAEMINTIEKNLYHDNSRVTPADVDANPRARRANSKREPTFPMKLHSLLSDPDAEGVIVWLPHGRAWKIINQDKFETGLLGKYFEHGNMSSFMRQVNGWDFRRIVKGVDEQSYYHEVSIQLDRHLILMWHHLRIDLNLIAPFLALDLRTSIQTVACVQPQISFSFVVCPIFAR